MTIFNPLNQLSLSPPDQLSLVDQTANLCNRSTPNSLQVNLDENIENSPQYSVNDNFKTGHNFWNEASVIGLVLSPVLGLLFPGLFGSGAIVGMMVPFGGLPGGVPGRQLFGQDGGIPNFNGNPNNGNPNNGNPNNGNPNNGNPNNGNPNNGNLQPVGGGDGQVGDGNQMVRHLPNNALLEAANHGVALAARLQDNTLNNAANLLRAHQPIPAPAPAPGGTVVHSYLNANQEQQAALVAQQTLLNNKKKEAKDLRSNVLNWVTSIGVAALTYCVILPKGGVYLSDNKKSNKTAQQEGERTGQVAYNNQVANVRNERNPVTRLFLGEAAPKAVDESLTFNPPSSEVAENPYYTKGQAIGQNKAALLYMATNAGKKFPASLRRSNQPIPEIGEPDKATRLGTAVLLGLLSKKANLPKIYEKMSE